MKNLLGLIRLVTLVIIPHLLVSPSFADKTATKPKEKFHLYLLVGQSNMAGRGKVEALDKKPHPRVLMLTKENQWTPAVAPLHFDKPFAGTGIGRTFGIRIANGKPDVTVGLIPCAAGGSPISAWEPGGYHGQTKSHPWDDAIKRAKLAMRDGVLKGILWHQGESDSQKGLAGIYEKKLHELVNRFREELNAPEVPFLAGQMGQFSERPWSDAKKLVDSAHRTLPKKVKRTAFVSSDDLGHKGDKIHFSAAAFRELGERYAKAYLEHFASPTPTSVPAKRPNILFAIADDWGFGHAGAYGCNWVRTPSFDRVARDGILFKRAYTPNAKCAPSRAIILTGCYSWQLEQAANHQNVFPAKFGGFIETLEANDYFTGYTGKGWGPGIANNAAGKRRLITGRSFAKRKAKPPARGISHNDYSANFSDFLAEAPEGKAWCFWYGTTEPHRRYEYGNAVKSGKKLSDVDRVPAFWPDNEMVRNDMLDYSMEVEHYDMHLGRILAALKESGQLDDTLVIATSDHGMPFPRCKGQAYESSNHIPMAAMWSKGINGKGRIVDDYVSFADLAPTFLEVAGVKDPAPIMQPITGRSLTDVFDSPKSGQVIPERDHVLIGKERHDVGRPANGGYPIRGIVKGDKLYIRNYETNRWPGGNPETGYLNCDGSPTKTVLLDQRREGNPKFWQMNFGKRPTDELYDLKADPDCVKNLAEDQAHLKLKYALANQMEKELTVHGDPRQSGNGKIFDSYPFVGNWNNFFENFTSGKKTPGTGWVNASDYEKEALD
jgi:N-sulfoglucosamine sulfohydrolase